MGTAGWEVPEKLLIDTHSSIYFIFQIFTNNHS
jgi:hypothetical protein